MEAFIAEHGFKPMLSEYDSFPIAPDQGNVDNCIKNVEQFADIMVLIVGKRAGWIMQSGRSVTNAEYLHARAKGIPVYIFIDRSVLDLIPFWKANPGAALPGFDSPKLLEFADSLRSSDVWSFPFQKGAEIVDTLRSQWASLFQDCIALWRQARRHPLPSCIRKQTGEAFRLAVQRPPLWEYLLYLEALKFGIAELADEKRDAELGFCFGVTRQQLRVLEFKDWIETAFEPLEHLASSINKLFTTERTEKAFGPPGVSGDPEQIIYIADRLVATYRESIHWVKLVHGIVAHQAFDPLRLIMVEFAFSLMRDIEAYAAKFEIAMDDLKNNPPVTGEKREINLCLTLGFPEGLSESHEAELARLLPIFVSLITNDD